MKVNTATGSKNVKIHSIYNAEQKHIMNYNCHLWVYFTHRTMGKTMLCICTWEFKYEKNTERNMAKWGLVLHWKFPAFGCAE